MQPITITSDKYGDFQLQKSDEPNSYLLTFDDGKRYLAKKQVHTPNQDWTLTGPDGTTMNDAMIMQNHIGKLIDQALKAKR